eukprot:GFKZ01004252.1.p1 GENE.GFKZ01004252.1~~GFKZ01004252.1.p1  ORF type:complete len:372 (-),score=46.19 GFKZ01004252.1:1174-2289(-)
MGRSRPFQTVRKTLQSSNRVPHNTATPPLPSTSDDAPSPSAPIQVDSSPLEEPRPKFQAVQPTRSPGGPASISGSRYKGGDPFTASTSGQKFPRNESRVFVNKESIRGEGQNMGQRSRVSAWKEKFPKKRMFPRGVSWNLRRRPTDGGRQGDEEIPSKSIRVPSAGCSLARQEAFAKELNAVLTKGEPLTVALNFVDMNAPEDIAKSIMTDEEWKMYKAWNEGDNLPAEDWTVMVEDMEDFEKERDSEDWEQNAKVLNEIYRRNDLTKRHARAWWMKNAAWTPLPRAVLLMRKEQQTSELIACKEVLIQMEQHRRHIERRLQLYAVHFVRKYKENTAVVMDILHRRIAFLEDDKNVLGEPLPNSVNFTDKT